MHDASRNTYSKARELHQTNQPLDLHYVKWLASPIPLKSLNGTMRSMDGIWNLRRTFVFPLNWGVGTG